MANSAARPAKPSCSGRQADWISSVVGRCKPAPREEAGFGQAVACAKGAHAQAAGLPQLDPPLPLLVLAQIARSAVDHGFALLSEDIATCLSRTEFAERTPKDNNSLVGKTAILQGAKQSSSVLLMA
jgi:hypothetical protein